MDISEGNIRAKETTSSPTFVFAVDARKYYCRSRVNTMSSYCVLSKLFDSNISDLTVITEKYTDLSVTDSGNHPAELLECYNGFENSSFDLNSQSDGDLSEQDCNVNSSPITDLAENPEEDRIEADWLKYWEEKGDEIVNKSWLEKYRDYINPEFDLSTWVGSGEPEVSETSDSNTTDADEADGSCKGKLPEDGLSEGDTDTLWLQEWHNHYSEIYFQERSKFFEVARTAEEEADMCAELRNKSLRKYWVMRYHLFSKFDDGIKLDEESWFSVTPETIAKHIAARCRRVDGVIVDAFCGCGGNTIQFAKKYSKVIAIDIDPVKIEYAKHNAALYGVEDKIDFVVGNYLHLAPHLKADVVFLSPPWGGPEYANVPIFDLKKMKPLDGYTIFEVTKEITQNIAFYAPRNTNKNQLMQLAGENNFVEIERNMFKKRVKAVTARFRNSILKFQEYILLMTNCFTTLAIGAVNSYIDIIVFIQDTH
ncbi:unnamed protein product [Allacma fusca]|uniref:Trimethylguanosine synthase n=1 Tax=Allacma fusca TaxID=39272 RepID=A0A8J2LK27_9HEXA|nr:unnamed protein product [Allacma fusca]